MPIRIRVQEDDDVRFGKYVVHVHTGTRGRAEKIALNSIHDTLDALSQVLQELTQKDLERPLLASEVSLEDTGLVKPEVGEFHGVRLVKDEPLATGPVDPGSIVDEPAPPQPTL